MHNRLLSLVLLLALCIALVSITVYTADTGSEPIYYFYLYGTHNCPHCRAMEDFLTREYGEDHLYFCDVTVDEECSDKLASLVQATGEGILNYVPQIYVVYNCTVTALVIGEVRDREFLESFLETNTGSEVPLYLGRNHVANLVIRDHKSFIQVYLNYGNLCSAGVGETSTTSPSTSSGGWSQELLAATALAAIVAVALAIVYVVKRR